MVSLDQMANKIDEVGNVYGRLTVVSETVGSKSGVHWLCTCECGKEIIVLGIHLRSGNNKSCGCLQTFLPGEAAANRVMSHYIEEAKRRNLVWELSKEEFLVITQLDCFYCGSPPTRISAYHNATGGYKYNGVDRLNNEEGYFLDNVVSCCSWCNWAKKDRTVKEYMDWNRRISEKWSR